MTDPAADLLPEGLEDRLPQSTAAAARIERAVLAVLDAHGYDRVRPPLIEFMQSIARRMDGVRTRKLFRFVDPKSLRTLALRSDMTPQVGRIAATGLAGKPRPLRLCYAGQVVRIAGDQLDPRREALQLGAELIGSDTVAAAAEVVELAIAALEAAGATGMDRVGADLVDLVVDGAVLDGVDELRGRGALVADHDLEPLVEEGHLAEAVGDRLEGVVGGLEDVVVGPEAGRGAGLVRRLPLLQRALGNPHVE